MKMTGWLFTAILLAGPLNLITCQDTSDEDEPLCTVDSQRGGRLLLNPRTWDRLRQKGTLQRKIKQARARQDCVTDTEGQRACSVGSLKDTESNFVCFLLDHPCLSSPGEDTLAILHRLVSADCPSELIGDDPSIFGIEVMRKVREAMKSDNQTSAKDDFLAFVTSDYCSMIPRSAGGAVELMRMLKLGLENGALDASDLQQMKNSCLWDAPATKQPIRRALSKVLKREPVTIEDVIRDIGLVDAIQIKQLTDIKGEDQKKKVAASILASRIQAKQRGRQRESSGRKSKGQGSKTRKRKARAKTQTTEAITTAKLMRPIQQSTKEDMTELYKEASIICNFGPDELERTPADVACPDESDIDVTADVACVNVLRSLYKKCSGRGTRLPSSVTSQATADEIEETGDRLSGSQLEEFVDNFNNDSEARISKGQRKALTNKVRESIQPRSQLPKETIKRLKVGLKALNFVQEVLPKIRDGVQDLPAFFCDVIASGPSCFNSEDNERRVLEYCLNVTDNDLGRMESLLNVLTPAMLDNITSDTIVNNLEYLQVHVCSLETRLHIVNVWKNKYNGVSAMVELDTIPFLNELGTLIVHLSDSELQTMMRHSSMAMFLTNVEEKLSDGEEPVNCGCGADLIKTFRRWRRQTLADLLVQDALDSAPTQGKRRKRSISVTCDTLQSAGTANLNETMLSYLEQSVFVGDTACRSSLNVKDLNPGQLHAIAESAKKYLSSTDRWINTIVPDLGVVILGLTPDEIRNIPSEALTDTVINEIGGKNVESPSDLSEQYAALVERSLEHAGNPTLAEVDGAFLQNLGGVVAGLTAANISSLRAAAIDSAAVVLGSQTVYTEAQLTAWAGRLKVVVGAEPSEWPISKIQAYGTLLAGLGSTFLGNLNSSQIEALSTDAISLIPDSEMGQLSDTFFEALSDSQRLAVTSTQRSRLQASAIAILDGTSTSDMTSSGPQVTSTESSHTDSTMTRRREGVTNREQSNADTATTSSSQRDDSVDSRDATTTTATAARRESTEAASVEATEAATNTSSGRKDRSFKNVPVATSVGDLERKIQSGAIAFSRDLTPASLARNLPANAGESAEIQDEVLRSQMTTPQKLAVLKGMSSKIESMVGQRGSNFDASYVAKGAQYMKKSVINQMTDEQILDVARDSSFKSESRKKVGAKLGQALQRVPTDELKDKMIASKRALAGVPNRKFKALLDKTTVDDNFMTAMREADLTKKQMRSLSKKYLDAEGVDIKEASESRQLEVVRALGPKIAKNLPPTTLQSLKKDALLEVLRNSDDDGFSDDDTEMTIAAKTVLRPNAFSVALSFKFDKAAIDDLPAVDRKDVLEKTAVSFVVAKGLRDICNLAKDIDGIFVCDIRGAMSYEKCVSSPLTIQKAKDNYRLLSHIKSADVSRLCPDFDSFKDILRASFRRDFCLQLNGRSHKELVICAKKVLSSSSTAPINDLDTCAAFANVAPKLDEDNFNKLCPQRKDEFCEKLAEQDFTNALQSETHSLAKRCFSGGTGLNPRSACTCGDDDGDGDINSICASIQASDIEGGDGTGNDPLYSCEDVVASMDVLACNVLSCDARTAMYNCIKKLYPDSYSDIEHSLVLLPDQLSQADIDGISQDVFCSMASDIRNSRKRFNHYKQKRAMRSLKAMPCMLEMKRSSMKSVMKKIKDCLATTQPSRRRRRDTDTLTCDYIKTLDNAAKFDLTPTQLKTLSTDDFLDCLEDLGTQSGFSAEQFEALAESAVPAFGDVSQWTPDTISDLKGIVSGLSNTKLGQLDLSDIEAVSAIGSYGNWTNAKLQTAFAEYLKDARSDNASSVPKEDMRMMGDLICGASSAHIAEMMSSHVCEAVSEIGLSDKCEATQLQQFVVHTKSCFGSDVTEWTNYEISGSGATIGGLPKEDIKKLSMSQVESIKQWAIPQIPHTEFSAFTKEQLRWLSTEQAAATTKKQWDVLDPMQKSALRAILLEVKDDIGDEFDPIMEESGGPELLPASILPFATTIMAAVLRI